MMVKFTETSDHQCDRPLPSTLHTKHPKRTQRMLDKGFAVASFFAEEGRSLPWCPAVASAIVRCGGMAPANAE